MSPSGIYNSGNTCGLNSLLQCMASAGLHRALQPYIGNSPLVHHSFKILEALCLLQNSTVLNIAPFIQELRNRSKGLLASGEQMDVSEIWLILMDMLINDCREKPQDIPKSVNQWMIAFEKDRSRLFAETHGMETTVTRCNKHRSTRHEVFNCLFVPVECPTIQGCLDAHLETDIQLTDWECDECKRKVNALTSVVVSRAPPVFAIALRRYNCKTPVDISRMITLNRKAYKLVGVALHYGVMFGGHYASICMRNGEWYIFDDDHVRPIGNCIDQALQKNTNAYMLFYVLAS